MKCKYCGGKLEVCTVFGFYTAQCIKCKAIHGFWNDKDRAEAFVKGGAE